METLAKELLEALKDAHEGAHDDNGGRPHCLTCKLIEQAELTLTPTPERRMRGMDTVKKAQQLINKWHDDDANFERELMDGTPAWLALCRQIIFEAQYPTARREGGNG